MDNTNLIRLMEECLAESEGTPQSLSLWAELKRNFLAHDLESALHRDEVKRYAFIDLVLDIENTKTMPNLLAHFYKEQQNNG